MYEANLGSFGATAEDLDAVEREIAAVRDELVALRARTRVMEVESSSWKVAPAAGRGQERGAFIGFVAGLFGMMMIGLLIASVIAR